MSAPPQSRTSELRPLLALAVPAMLTQLAQMTLGVVDSLMLGHAGVLPLSAASLANAYGFACMMLGVGVVLGTDPLMSQAHGAGQSEQVGLVAQRGVVVALLVSVPVMVAWYFGEAALLLLGQERELARAAGGYLRLQLWSVPCFTVFMALRQYLQSRGLVRPGLYVMLAVNVVNALLDYAFIFGHFGIPALGLRGAGMAAGLARLFEVGLLALVIWRARLHQDAWVPWSRASVSLSGLKDIFRIGVPIGLQWFMEILAFSLAAMMAGWISQRAISAHTICLNVASLSFMMPLGLSIGAAIRVGNLVGEGREAAARRAAQLALRAVLSIMVCAAALMAATSGVLPRAYTSDLQVIALASMLLPIAAGFQIFDGVQVVSIGILRGLGHTRMPALSHFIAYYVLGLPLGYYFAFPMGHGVVGLWWGLVVGLLVAATLLFTAAQLALRRPLGRVDHS